MKLSLTLAVGFALIAYTLGQGTLEIEAVCYETDTVLWKFTAKGHTATGLTIDTDIGILGTHNPCCTFDCPVCEPISSCTSCVCLACPGSTPHPATPPSQVATGQQIISGFDAEDPTEEFHKYVVMNYDQTEEPWGGTEKLDILAFHVGINGHNYQGWDSDAGTAGNCFDILSPCINPEVTNPIWSDVCSWQCGDDGGCTARGSCEARGDGEFGCLCYPGWEGSAYCDVPTATAELDEANQNSKNPALEALLRNLGFGVMGLVVVGGIFIAARGGLPTGAPSSKPADKDVIIVGDTLDSSPDSGILGASRMTQATGMERPRNRSKGSKGSRGRTGSKGSGGRRRSGSGSGRKRGGSRSSGGGRGRSTSRTR